MWFSKPKNSGQPEHDRVARSLADKIIQLQRTASEQLNKKANRYKKHTQLRWFWLGCGLAFLAILCSVLLTIYRPSPSTLRSGELPAHIGKSSEGVPLRPDHPKDSVNAKNKAYGNNE